MNSHTARAGHGRIVVGVDGSAAGSAALRWAARLAPALRASIQVVSAWDYPFTDDSTPFLGLDWEQISRDTVARSTLEVFADAPPEGLVTTVRRGHAARVLLEAAHGATLLVVGNRGLGGFPGLLLGSVSRNVTEHATCPVLVVPEPERDPE